MRTSVRRGSYVDPERGQQRFRDFAEQWAAAQDWKSTTRDAWPYVMRRLDPLIGGRRLASIDRLMLQQARSKLAERYAARTVELTMHYAGSVLRAAHATGRIGHDPTVGLRAPKRRAGEGEVGPDDVPTRAEALAILAAAPARYLAAIALGMTGMRIGEVLGLTADRIDLDRGRVVIDRQLQREAGKMRHTTPKAEKVRTIFVPSFVVVELRRHLRDHQGGGILFRGVRGTETMRRDQFYASAWYPALEGAGMPRRFKFHSLRHHAASAMLAAGADIAQVAAHLGDTVETVARVYVHFLRDREDALAELVERALGLPESAAAADF
jgi:integrase